MTRDIATAFNRIVEKEIFTLPEGLIDNRVMTVPGIDGQKMSKSRNNFINIFLSDKELKTVIGKIVTDSKGLEESKDPDTCNVFKLYELVANTEQTQSMRQNYINGGFGYGHAKAALLDVIITKYKNERETYMRLMQQSELYQMNLYFSPIYLFFSLITSSKICSVGYAMQQIFSSY